ncbi:Nitronate monooxygenase-domain-containing protein [Podospora appendiculata]|uniref:Nitronate monooxygenase-domain-containing protein n=1 Tax=Podospora appendiculata TaxID=314037 RepID=A0AAE1C6Y5_9PEZI|nr:Nitronate monooxygenase-domain-containing protein [Podospora appendiculata]
MARTSGGLLAAAVSNAGGLGVIGGFMYTPDQLRDIIAELKANLTSPSLPFGIDLALPQLGGGARPTNHDYTHGKLDELIDITIASGARLFVSAVGVPPGPVIDRLHAAGILALDLGVDMVCAQGGEGGGHTGAIASSVLIPAVVDVARRYRPAMLGGSQPALVGAAGVWVGTRFVASVEASCSQQHKDEVVSCGFEGTERTLVLSGRPLRMKTNDCCASGVVPIEYDLDQGNEIDPPHLMGQVAGAIKEMVAEAVEMLEIGAGYLKGSARGGSRLESGGCGVYMMRLLVCRA